MGHRKIWIVVFVQLLSSQFGDLTWSGPRNFVGKITGGPLKNWLFKAGRPFSTSASKNGEAEVAYVAQQLTEGRDVTLTDPEGGQMTPEDVREGISKGVSDRVELRAATGPKHSKPEPIHTLRIKDCAGLGPNGWSGSVF